MIPPGPAPANPAGLSLRVCRLLAGVDVGVTGAAVLTGWLIIHSRLAGEFWWAKLNVAGGLFYGTDVYAMGPGRATLGGGALLLVLYTAAGLIFAQLAPLAGYVRNAFFALCYSTVYCLAAEKWIWPRIDPFAPGFFPFPVMLAGHLLFALALTRFPARFRSLAATFGDEKWTADLLYPEQSPPQPPLPTEISPPPSRPSSTPDIVESEADRLE